MCRIECTSGFCNLIRYSKGLLKPLGIVVTDSSWEGLQIIDQMYFESKYKVHRVKILHRHLWPHGAEIENRYACGPIKTLHVISNKRAHQLVHVCTILDYVLFLEFKRVIGVSHFGASGCIALTVWDTYGPCSRRGGEMRSSQFIDWIQSLTVVFLSLDLNISGKWACATECMFFIRWQNVIYIL